jgi:hypothetical protein
VVVTSPSCHRLSVTKGNYMFSKKVSFLDVFTNQELTGLYEEHDCFFWTPDGSAANCAVCKRYYSVMLPEIDPQAFDAEPVEVEVEE